jgi:3',5'-cyclic AMP phosphodiesterase CpdA
MWQFVQISDAHLGSLTDGRWNNSFVCTMMPDVMRCLRGDLAELQPAFILATGDMGSQPTCDAMYGARDFFDWLGFPYYPMGGNHDFVVEQSRAWFAEAYGAHLPTGKPYYSFDHENLRFVVVDGHWVWRDGRTMPYSEVGTEVVQEDDTDRAKWIMPDAQLTWLDTELSREQDRPTVVVCHYPAIEIPSRLHRPGMKNAGSLQNGAEILAVLRKHPQVRAYFSGHLHMNIVEVVDEVTHVVTASLPEYPCEYREVEVHADRMVVTSRGLSDPTFAARSLLPGGAWTAGQPCDRHVTIPLT